MTVMNLSYLKYLWTTRNPFGHEFDDSGEKALKIIKSGRLKEKILREIILSQESSHDHQIGAVRVTKDEKLLMKLLLVRQNLSYSESLFGEQQLLKIQLAALSNPATTKQTVETALRAIGERLRGDIPMSLTFGQTETAVILLRHPQFTTQEVDKYLKFFYNPANPSSVTRTSLSDALIRQHPTASTVAILHCVKTGSAWRRFVQKMNNPASSHAKPPKILAPDSMAWDRSYDMDILPLLKRLCRENGIDTDGLPASYVIELSNLILKEQNAEQE